VKRALTALRPLICTVALGIPLALVIAYVIQHVFEVPLEPKSFRFERPLAATLLLGALLVLVARGFLYMRRVPRLRVSRGADLRALAPGHRIWVNALTTALRVLAVGCMALALMGPQSIHARSESEVDGIDIVLTLDLSLSMQATRQVVSDFIGRRANDRIGAVIFGRDAYTLLPLTTDHQALQTMVAELELGVIDGRGTAIGNAIGVAINRLRRSPAKSRVIILATDGNSNSGNVSPTQAAEYARALGIKVYTILMGADGDAPVQTGHDLFGRPVFDRGNFPINPELLRKVADQTGGAAFQVVDREGLEKSFHAILDKLERSQIEDAGRVYGELFAAFAGPALILLVLELALSGLVLRRWP
jgi:Ca-activated chloride channel homolog